MTSAVFFLLFLLLSSIAYCGPLFEAKAGYFFFTERKMRKVFDDGGLDVQFSAIFPIKETSFSVYTSVEYLKKFGKSLNDHQKTSIWEIPASLGLQPSFCVGSQGGEYYFTLGPRYFYVHAHNRSSFVPKKMDHHGYGGFVNMGYRVMGRYFVINVFGEYSYGKMHFHSSHHRSKGHTVQVGGVTGGGSIGCHF